MICPNCGNAIPDGSAFCPECGGKCDQAPQQAPQMNNQPAYNVPPVNPYQQQGYSQPVYTAPQSVSGEIPPEYKPISPWGYVGYSFLFSLPIVGFILLIVFSVQSDGNINRRNLARAYWCALLIALGIMIIMLIITLALGASVSDMLSGYYY